MPVGNNMVIVRGMKEEWFMEHFKNMEVYFGGDPKAIPKKDADYIGFYLESPISAITHLGLVNKIERYDDGATFYLKAIIKLDDPIKTVDKHAIRKQEYWKLEDLGIHNFVFSINDFFLIGKIGNANL